MVRATLSALAVIAVGCLAIGCESKDPNENASNDTAASTPSEPAKPTPPKPTPPPDRHLVYKTPNVQKGDIAVVQTKLGTIKFTFLEDVAPKHVANFEKLAEAGFYDGTAFHRAVPGFMIQGGDPNTLGTDASLYGQGTPGWTVNAEFNKTKFDRGIVGMARGQEPNSAGSQFFIMVTRYPSLDNQYTAFGKVTEGMDVADKIVQLPTSGQQISDVEQARVTSIKIVHPVAK